MEQEEIIQKVSKALSTKKIHQAFHPIIREFFVRAVEQYKWTEEDLQKALKRFDNLQDIQFENMRGLEKGSNKIRVNKSKGTINSHIAISIEYLKAILAYDVEKIEEFINVMIHELGHPTKMKKVHDGKIEVGLQIINAKDMRCIQGNIIDEFAEILCAKKLQKGNLGEERYAGYFHMQNAVRAVIYALGLTEEEFFCLQWQGRKTYEAAVVRELGEKLGKTYLSSFETILDSIHVNYIRKNKAAIIVQVEECNSLINEIFRERIRALNEKGTIQQLAKLDVEQTICNVALQDMLIELGIEGKIKVGVRHNLLESEMTASRIEGIRKEGDRLLEERGKIQRREAKFYDNTLLIEEIYEGFLKYPMRLLPRSKIPEIIRAKRTSRQMRMKKLEESLGDKNDISTQEESYIQKHRKFVRGIVDLAKSNVSQVIGNVAIPKQSKEDRGYKRER